MTSQSGKQIITIHILPNISRNKGNQTTKFGQLIEHNLRNIFLRKLCRKCGRKTNSRRLFGFLEKVKISGQHLSLDRFWYTLPWLGNTKIKTKLYNTSDCYFRYMLNFQFLLKSLGSTSPSYFAYNFSRKILHSIDRPNVIVTLSILIEILSNMCNVIISQSATL